MPLYMAWRGALGDTGLWWSQTRNGTTWTPQQQVLGATSMERPALVLQWDFTIPAGQTRSFEPKGCPVWGGDYPVR
ncbi:hypothetical protein ACH4MD_42445, partial [Streptomyces rimosus]